MKRTLLLFVALSLLQSCRTSDRPKHTVTYYYDVRNVLSQRLANLDLPLESDSLNPSGTYYNYGNYFFREALDLHYTEMSSSAGNGYRIVSYKLAPGNQLTEAELTKALPADSLTWLNNIVMSRNDMRRMHQLKSYNKDWHRPTKLPTFNFADRQNQQINNTTVKGFPLVINFWSSYCPPCIREIPELNRWLDSIKDVTFIAVTYQNAAIAKKSVEKYGFKWNQVVEDSTLTTWLPSESHYPTHVVADQNGYIRCMEFGSSPEIHKRVLDTLKAVIENGPLTRPRHYKDLHHEDEYSSY